MTSAGIDHVPFAEHVAGLDWQQGEHVTLIGPTGMGKTTLGLALLDHWSHVVVIGAKAKDRDDTMDAIRWRRHWSRPLETQPAGLYRRVRTWPPGSIHPDADRVLLWPKFRRMAEQRQQAATIGGALESMFEDGGWCIFADECNYLVDDLGLGDPLRMIWRQGRSAGIALVAVLQRPRYAPLEAYSQARHLYLWRMNDREDVKRLRDIAGDVDREQVAALVARLPKYHALHVDTNTGAMVTTSAPRLG